MKYHHEKEGHEMEVNFTLSHLREKYFCASWTTKSKKDVSRNVRNVKGDSGTVQHDNRWHRYLECD